MSQDYPFKPGRGSSHRWALDEVERLPAGGAGPAPLRVLDVGAGPGHVAGALCAARPPGQVELWAVEPHPGPDLLAAARAVVPRIEDVEAVGFDVALLLDVLEHVADPADLLGQAARRVRPGGVLLVSVPNVVHWSIRALVAAGRFRYTARGILDRGHLRFFTRASLRELVEGAGLLVEAEDASIAPVEQVLALPGPLLGRAVRQAAARAWPDLLAYQLLLRLRKPAP